VTFLETWLQSEGSLFALECARVAGLIIAAPLAWLNAPTRVRGALVLMLGFVVHGASGAASVPASLLEVAWVFVTELALGAAMGLVVRCIVAMAEVAAETMAPMLGLGVAHIFDSSSHSTQNVMTTLLRQVSILIALVSGVHRVLLQALLGGFKLVPVGSVRLPANGLKVIWELSTNVLLVGVRLALPMIAVLFIVQIALAFVSRAAPQLQVFSVGFAVATAVGLTTLILVFPDFSRGLMVEYSQVSTYLEQLLRDFGAPG
jgi:flagellar biosynthetic protein FliR